MCKICGNPDCDNTPEEAEEILRELNAKMEEIIPQAGRFCLQLGSPDEGYCYTIGHAHKGLPDLIIHAQSAPFSGRMLNALAEHLEPYWRDHREEMRGPRGYLVAHDDFVQSPYQLCLVELDLEETLRSRMIQTKAYYERKEIAPVGVLQVFWPDSDNRHIYDGLIDPRVWALQSHERPVNKEVLGPLARASFDLSTVMVAN